MSKHKHHIIPRYRCKELGIDPDFDENYVMVERLDHARIHWGYKCDDLEPLFEYITPAQWIIDLIPRGDNRDVGAAVLTAKGELDGIDMSGENNPMWKGGITYDMKVYEKKYRRRSPEYHAHMKKHNATPERKAYMKAYKQTPEYKEYNKAYGKAYKQTPEHKAYMKAYQKEYRQTPEYKERNRKRMNKYNANRRAKNKAETQGDGTLEAFLK